MAITYRDLQQLLNGLSEQQLDQTATIFVPGIDEYYPMHDNITITDDTCDVLDPNHVVLTIE